MLEGFLRRPLGVVLRAVFGGFALAVLFAPTGTLAWGLAVSGLAIAHITMWAKSR
jgi:hypothetical protein